MFPNPTYDKVYIKNLDNLDIEIQLINLTGELVLKSKYEKFISLESISSGFYILLIKHNGLVLKTEKLIVK